MKNVSEPAYWDTSTAVKLYIDESDSAYFLEIIAASDRPLVTSKLAIIEILSTCYRREKSGDLPPGGALKAFRHFEADCSSGRAITIAIDDEVLAGAREIVRAHLRRPRGIMIRSLDAIHVATALTARCKTIISTDTRLREVAAGAGLRLIP